MSFGIPTRNGLGLGLLASTSLATTGEGFTPFVLFSGGESGAWFDPSDISTLYQDAAGTTPVTSTGQAVALMLDKSGRGNNATQSITLSRPIYRVDTNGFPYLEFDGSDDFMSTSAINFTSTNKMTLFAGVRKLTDAAVGSIMELSAAGIGTNGTIGVLAPSSATLPNYRTSSRGTAITSVASPNNYAAPNTAVLGVTSDIAAPLLTLRVNGAEVGASVATQGTGTYGNHAMFIGRRGGTSLPFNGRLYGLILRGAATTAALISQTETWLNQRTGAY